MISESLSPSEQSAADIIKEEKDLLEKRWEVSPNGRIKLSGVHTLTMRCSETSQICRIVRELDRSSYMSFFVRR